MDKFIEILSTFNLPTVLSIGAIFWYFTRDIKQEIKKYEEKTDAKIEAQTARTDRLYEMFIDLLKEKKNG
jgi:hypothetical protein